MLFLIPPIQRLFLLGSVLTIQIRGHPGLLRARRDNEQVWPGFGRGM